jgi:uncharacterized protein YggE
MNVVLTLALLSLLPLTARAQDKTEPPLITVNGEAEVNVVPDEVIFDLRVQTFHKDMRLAKSQTDERLRALMALTRRYKVAPQDVQTDYIRLEPRYRSNNESRLLLGYLVRKDLVFKLKDVSQAENVLSEVMESGVTQINSIRFQTSQMRKYKDQARASAIKAAQEKAIALAGEIGQKIGKAHSIVEVGQSGSSFNNIAASVTSNSTTFATSDGEATESEGTLALGQIKVSARVLVRFELQ